MIELNEVLIPLAILVTYIIFYGIFVKSKRPDENDVKESPVLKKTDARQTSLLLLLMLLTLIAFQYRDSFELSVIFNSIMSCVLYSFLERDFYLARIAAKQKRYIESKNMVNNEVNT